MTDECLAVVDYIHRKLSISHLLAAYKESHSQGQGLQLQQRCKLSITSISNYHLSIKGKYNRAAQECDA
ncbi:hypothetical protein QQP08_001890 [Theobroma cacao]|nr:hypothetical protein QQP08_001890 [Theobroma cacao]